MSRPRPVTLALCSALCLLLAACGSEGAAPTPDAVVTARQQLDAGEASAALSTVNKALANKGDQADVAALRLAAAEACIQLKRLGEALDHASAGLDDRRAGAQLRADLGWAEGKAALLRYRALGDEDDWRRANTALERGAEGGQHQVEAASLLVIMHHTHTRGDAARKARYAELVQRLAPGSKEAAAVAALMQPPAEQQPVESDG